METEVRGQKTEDRKFRVAGFGPQAPGRRLKTYGLWFAACILWLVARSLQPAFAGNLDSSAAPTSDTTRMYTLEQIYDKLHEGADATKQSGGFNEPAAAPGSTMHTLDNIYDDFNTDVASCNATAADVLSGKTFFATSGTTRGTNWGPVSGTASAGGLPATGQTTSNEPYLSDAVTDYPSSGEKVGGDGYYHKGAALSYTVSDPAGNGQEVVTDNNTGLIWVRDGTGAGCNNGTGLNWKAAIAFCENLTFAGSSDWRLPNTKELMSIVDYSISSPAIQETNAFQHTRSGFYWSSTTFAGSTTYAWLVYFSSGYVDFGNKVNGYYVRPVRGGQ